MKKEIDLENGFKLVIEGNISHALNYERTMYEQRGAKKNSQGNAKNINIKISVVKKRRSNGILNMMKRQA